MHIQSTDPTLPNYARPEYMAALPDLLLMADVLGGTRAMHTNSRQYIKKWAKEADAIYDRRRVCEKFFGGTRYTLGAGVGALFAKPVQMVWNGAETVLADIWPNLDAAGTAGEVLMKRFAEMSLRDGFGIMHTSFPPRPVDGDGKPIEIHGGNQDAFAIRPSVQLYTRLQAINWFVEVVRNQSLLTRLVLAESATVADGIFGVRTVERFRDIRLGVNADGQLAASFQLYELQAPANGAPIKRENFSDAGSGAYLDTTGAPVPHLPVAIGYTGRTDAPVTADIPLLDVANANIAHWEKATEINWYEQLCAYPQRVVKGRLLEDPITKLPPTELPSGPGHAIQIEADGDIRWDELAGTSLVQLKESRQEKLTQMGQMGSGFLTPDARTQETAQAHRLDAIAEQANIATAGQGIQDGGNLMLEQLCGLLGIEKAKAATLAINMDFERKKLDAQEMTAIFAGGAAGYFSRDMVWDALEEGDRLPRGFDRSKASTAIENETPVALPALQPSAPLPKAA